MKPLINSPFAPYMLKNLSAMLNLLSFSELPQVFFMEIFDKVAHFIAIVHLKIFHIKIIWEIILLWTLFFVYLAELLCNSIEVNHIIPLILRKLSHWCKMLIPAAVFSAAGSVFYISLRDWHVEVQASVNRKLMINGSCLIIHHIKRIAFKILWRGLHSWKFVVVERVELGLLIGGWRHKALLTTSTKNITRRSIPTIPSLLRYIFYFSFFSFFSFFWGINPKLIKIQF